VELYGRFAEVMLPPDRQPPLSKNCWIHICITKQILMNAYLSRFHINVLHPSSARYIVIPFFPWKTNVYMSMIATNKYME
jgi:hypothetical protein